MAETEKYGLLLAILEPPEEMEEEFNEWYDTEHILKEKPYPGSSPRKDLWLIRALQNILLFTTLKMWRCSRVKPIG